MDTRVPGSKYFPCTSSGYKLPGRPTDAPTVQRKYRAEEEEERNGREKERKKERGGKKDEKG